jgi:hypothetical protein
MHTRLEVDTVFPNCLQVELFVVYMSRAITSSAPTNAYPIRVSGFPPPLPPPPPPPVTRDHLSAPYKQGAGVDVFIFTTVYWSTDLTRIIIIHSHHEPRALWHRGSGPSLL